MIYSARTRKSLRNGKWMFFLDRAGQTCFISPASYHTSGAAISAARRKTRDLMAKVQLPELAGTVKFKVM